MKTMHNDEIMILGKELKIGDKAPNFKLITNELGYKSLEDFEKKEQIFLYYLIMIF